MELSLIVFVIMTVADISEGTSHTLGLRLRYPLVSKGELAPRQVTTNGRCGSDFGTVCEDNECCSVVGWCGVGYDYCSAPSCQIEYGPACDANVRPDGPATENTLRPHVGEVPYGSGIFNCKRYGDIALTYDDGPFDYTEGLLNLLSDYDAKATFFVTGRNLGKGAINDPSKPWRALIKRMVADGHQVASHTWSHQRLTEISESKFRNQMIYNEVAIADILGFFPTYMRPPYSASDIEVDGWLEELGYHITYFDLDTEGYLHPENSQIQLSKDIWTERVEGQTPSGAKFLQIEHDPVEQSASNLTSYMLESLFRNGFKAVTVGECLNDPRENWYRTLSGGDTQASMTGGGSQSTPTLSPPATTDGRCGPKFGDMTCTEQDEFTCCSKSGWCGYEEIHCMFSNGCQMNYGSCFDDERALDIAE